LLPAAALYLETALQIARTAVAGEYRFQELVTEGKQDLLKQIVESALSEDGLDHPCIKQVLVVIFFEQLDSWGRTFGHLFERKFSLQVLALAVSLVS
jgi:hypothetical protein